MMFHVRFLSFFPWSSWISDFHLFSDYLRLSRERTVPTDTIIDKEVLVDKRKISVSFTPDEEDKEFESPFDDGALRTCNPGQPTFMPDCENRAEKLFYREPFYFGKRDDDDDGEEEEIGEDEDDLARYSFSRQSRGSSMFVPGAKVSSSTLPSYKSSNKSIEPIALPSHLQPVTRHETSYSSLDLPSAFNDDASLLINEVFFDNMEFIYPPMPSIPLLSAKNEDASPPAPLPLLARRGLGALRIPSLIWTESCSITPISSLPTTPQHSEYAIQNSTGKRTGLFGRKRRLSNDDEADSTVREPPKKKTKAKAKSAVRDDASKFENKKRKRSLGENLRHILQNLSPTRLVHFSWGH